MTNKSRIIRQTVTMQDVLPEGGAEWQSTQGWRERAQAALAEKTRVSTDAWLKNSEKLAALMKQVLDVDIEGLPLEKPGDTIVLDGVRFRLLQYDAPTGDQLVILRSCKTCGKATSSALLKTLLDVAEALEEWDPQCRDCHQGVAASAVAQTSTTDTERPTQ